MQIIGCSLLLIVNNELQLLLLDLPEQVIESGVEVLHLLIQQLIQLLPSQLQQRHVLVGQLPAVQDHLRQVCDVRLQDVGY
jgi:hypothetical protein